VDEALDLLLAAEATQVLSAERAAELRTQIQEKGN